MKHGFQISTGWKLQNYQILPLSLEYGMRSGLGNACTHVTTFIIKVETLVSINKLNMRVQIPRGFYCFQCEALHACSNFHGDGVATQLKKFYKLESSIYRLRVHIFTTIYVCFTGHKSVFQSGSERVNSSMLPISVRSVEEESEHRISTDCFLFRNLQRTGWKLDSKDVAWEVGIKNDKERVLYNNYKEHKRTCKWTFKRTCTINKKLNIKNN